MLTGYAIGLFFHFVGMIALFVGFGLEWTGSSLLRRATTLDQARSSLDLYRLSQPVSGPGWLIQILTVGIVVALYIGFAMILPRVKKLRLALQEGTAPLPTATLTRTNDPMIATLIRVRFMLALGIVALMTYKPAMLSISLLILLGGIVLGLLCSIGILAKGSGRT
jgi:hypothetical protein